MAATPALDALEADALGHATWMLARIQQLDAAIPPGTPTSGACRWCSTGDGWRCRLVRRTGRRTVERWLHCDDCDLLTTPARERSRRNR